LKNLVSEFLLNLLRRLSGRVTCPSVSLTVTDVEPAPQVEWEGYWCWTCSAGWVGGLL